MSVKFNLETPVGNSLEGINRLSGWYIPDHGLRPQLYVACNGKREAALDWEYSAGCLLVLSGANAVDHQRVSR